MKLEQQVCNLELATRLKELGVKQESFFCWVNLKKDGWVLSTHVHALGQARGIRSGYGGTDIIRAFTVAELDEFLPKNSEHIKHFPSIDKPEQRACWYRGHIGYGKTMADAAAALLIYLIENKLLTV